MKDNYGDNIENIFISYNQLKKIDRGTLEFGFKWKPEDGIVLFPSSSLADYYDGFFRLQYPEIKIIILDWDSDPEEINKYGSSYPEALVVFCEMQSYLPYNIGIDYAKLAQILPSEWLGRVVTMRQLGEFLPPGTGETKFLDYFRRTDFPTEGSNRKKILEAFRLFQDNLSRETFLAILKRYLLRSDTLIPVINTTPYFEKLFTMGSEEVIVDCGAFTGDTLEIYLQKISPAFEQYHAFEPDPNNFAELMKTVSSLPEDLKVRVKAWPNAVGHMPKKLRFENRGALESRVDENTGDIEVDSVPLDMALKGIRPTFIKMDLEGFEAFALLGARNIIRESRPVLAICVYHYAFDFWELPLLISKFAKDYCFFLRAYNEIFDYIVYAVPKERVTWQKIHGLLKRQNVRLGEGKGREIRNVNKKGR